MSDLSCTATSTNVICGSSDGQIVVNATGGSGSYAYSKDGGTTWQVSNTFTNLTFGNYTIDVRDANAIDQTTCRTSCIATVGNACIAIVKVGTFQDDITVDGYAEEGETIKYIFAITNEGNVDLGNVVVTDPLFEAPNPVVGIIGPMPGEDVGNDGLLSPIEEWTFMAIYALTQDNINEGSVTNQATVTGTDPNGDPVMDTSDDDSPLEDDITITPLPEPPADCPDLDQLVSCPAEIPCPDSDAEIFNYIIEVLTEHYSNICETIEVSFDSADSFISCSDSDDDDGHDGDDDDDDDDDGHDDDSYVKSGDDGDGDDDDNDDDHGGGNGGSGIFSQTFYFKVVNGCTGEIISICPVTFYGECSYCTFTQGFWGNEGGYFPEKNDENSTEAIITSLITEKGPIVLGRPGASLQINTAECVIALLPSAGGSKPLAAGDAVADSPDCEAGDNDLHNGRLKNNLATNAIALQLNIWYNEVKNDKDLGAFSLDCVDIPESVLALLNDEELEYTATVQGLLDLVNDYLAGLYGEGSGSDDDAFVKSGDGGDDDDDDDQSLGGDLTEAVTAINEYWDECRSPDWDKGPDCDDDDDDDDDDEEECTKATDPNDPYGDEKYESYLVEFEDGWIVSGTTVDKKATVTLRNGQEIILHTSCSETFLGPDNEEGTPDDGYGRKEGPDPGQTRVVRFMFWKYEDDKEFDECCGGEIELSPPVECPEDCDDGNPCTTDDCDPLTGECIHLPIFGCDGTIDCSEDNDPNDSPGHDSYYSYWVKFENGQIFSDVSEDKRITVEVEGKEIALYVSCSEGFLGPDEEYGTADDGFGEKEGPHAEDEHLRVVAYAFWKYDDDNDYDECCSGSFDFTPESCLQDACDDGNPCTIDTYNPDTGECEYETIPGCEEVVGVECSEENDPNPSPGDDEYRSYYVIFEDGTVASGVVEDGKKVEVEVDGKDIELYISCSEGFLGPDEEEGTADDGYGEKEGPHEDDGHLRVVYYSFWKYDNDNDLDDCCSGSFDFSGAPCDDGDPCTEDSCDPETGECVFTPIEDCEELEITTDCSGDNDPHPSPDYDEDYRSYYIKFSDGTVLRGTIADDKKLDVEFGEHKMRLHISCSEEFIGPDRNRGTADDGYGEKEGPYENEGHPRVVLYSFWRYGEDNEYKECCAAEPEPVQNSHHAEVDDNDLHVTPRKEIVLYPNPSHDKIYLDLSDYQGMKGKFTIVNAIGEFVHQERVDEITALPVRFNLELPGGLYYIRISIGDVVIHKPFILVED